MFKKQSIVLLSFLLLYSFTRSTLAKQPKDKGPLTKITFVHYRRANAKPDWAGNNKSSSSSCYGYLGKGVLWKTFHKDIYVNPTNNDGMSSSFIKTTVSTSANTWEGAAGVDLFGTAVEDQTANWDDQAPDYRNEVSFANYSNDGVIAVTNVWGYFGGPPSTREIVEFDTLFNEHFRWGNADNDKSLMDLQNIATHEFGHGWGMGDIYDSSCDQVTMYGYSSEGEIIKRTLEAPDTTGIESLYK